MGGEHTVDCVLCLASTFQKLFFFSEEDNSPSPWMQVWGGTEAAAMLAAEDPNASKMAEEGEEWKRKKGGEERIGDYM